MIPTNLDECFTELLRELTDSEIKIFKAGSEDETIRYHNGLGRWMRNNWKLWLDSDLAKWFNSIGIHHADDMSGIILTSFWRHLHSKQVHLSAQVKFYQDYWLAQEASQEPE
jgi:hypothetical protein